MKVVDLYHELCNNTSLRKDLDRITANIHRMETNNLATPSTIGQELMDMLRLCNYNVAVLFPYLFPVAFNQEPLSLLSRPFGFPMCNMLPGSITTIRAGRQAAKSTTIGAKMLTVAHMLPYKQMYIAPHPDHTKTFARRLRELERFCRYQITESRYKQNDAYKEYPTGSVIELYHVYTDAVGIRGKTTDFLTIDEAQSFDGSLLPEVQQVTKATKFPIMNVMGTSLTVDTFLEAYYQNGSRSTWHIPLPHRKKTGERAYLDCGDKEMVIKAIGENSLVCPYTRKQIDPRWGNFVPELRSRVDALRVSMHVPQIIIPEYANIPVKWKEIYDAYKEYDTNKFLQEVLGIPTEHGARELTESDLRALCVLGSEEEVRKNAMRSGYYREIISGCDWGGSDYNRALHTKVSYTVHVMLGLTRDKKLDIIHMRRYSGMDYDEVANSIISDHNYFKAKFCGSDYGAGVAYNTYLRKSGGVDPKKHLVFNYSGNAASALSVPKGDHMFNQLTLNRNESITELFKAFKAQRIRCFDYEQAKTTLSDCLNVVRVQKENEATGSTGFRYIRAGDTPDDTLHAINFAYIIARLYLDEPLVGDKSDQAILRNSLLSGANTSAFSIPDPISG